jgi:hypothetical protein
VPRHEALLARTDPHVSSIARYVLDNALDSASNVNGIRNPARRAGVMRTEAVSKRTTLLVVRFRFHLELPGTHETRSLVTEDSRLLAFEGSPTAADWLTNDRVEQLTTAEATGNTAADQAAEALQRILNGIDALTPHLDQEAHEAANELLAAHRRVRSGAGAPRRGLDVRAETPVDLVGVYVLLPAAT